MVLNRKEPLIHLHKECVQLFCMIFWGPNEETCQGLLDGSWFRPLEKLNQTGDDFPAATLQKLKQIVNRFSDSENLFENLEAAYVRSFVNNGKWVIAPLYHSCYSEDDENGSGLLMGEPAMEMQKRFETAGLELNSEINEPPDHLSLELEYLFYLLNDAEKEEALEEARSFASNFMLPWIRRFGDRLNEEHYDRFYSLVTLLLIHLLEHIAGEKTD